MFNNSMFNNSVANENINWFVFTLCFAAAGLLSLCALVVFLKKTNSLPSNTGKEKAKLSATSLADLCKSQVQSGVNTNISSKSSPYYDSTSTSSLGLTLNFCNCCRRSKTPMVSEFNDNNGEDARSMEQKV
jgi:hypothetical protein